MTAPIGAPARAPKLGSAAALALVLGACGHGGDGGPDAACWPLASTPGGTVQLGTGDTAFEPMPAMLAFVANGSQSDPYLEVYGRITGIPPGDPDGNFFDPSNPKTKVNAVIPDLNLTLGVECPSTIPYVPAPDGSGAYDMLHSLRLGIGLTLQPSDVSGHSAHITIEVVGSNGLYAMDAMDVVLEAPITNGTDAGIDAAVDAAP